MRISEELRSTSLDGFKRSGNYITDARRFCEFHGREADNLDKVGLRLALGDPMTVHTLTESVCKNILAVRIENLPDRYPRFLESPFLIESKQDKYLFDDVHAIGGYIGDEDTFILLAYCKDNSLVLKKEKPFDGTKIEEINLETPQEFAHGYETKARNILPFVTILALMLEAERSPILIDGGSKKAKKRNQSKQKTGNQSGWVERRIYIDAKYASSRNSDPAPMDKDGKVKKGVFVQGFLRYQPYGPKHGLRKWIYIDGFESSRWSNKEDKKIIVDIKNQAGL